MNRAFFDVVVVVAAHLGDNVGRLARTNFTAIDLHSPKRPCRRYAIEKRHRRQSTKSVTPRAGALSALSTMLK